MAKEAIYHLGYPDCLGKALVVFKVLGALVLIIHPIAKRIKEWIALILISILPLQRFVVEL